MSITLFPLLTNSVVRSFAWITILGQDGILNNALMNIGLLSKPLTMLYTEFAIIIGSVYLFLPLMVITLVGILENIDSEIMEAAETLGANRLIAFVKVIAIKCARDYCWQYFSFHRKQKHTTPQLLGGNRNMY
jgi:putative spermidine/putrescine transport system permease protein